MVTLTRKELLETLFRCRLSEVVDVFRSIRMEMIVDQMGADGGSKYLVDHADEIKFDLSRPKEIIRVDIALRKAIMQATTEQITRGVRYYGWNVAITENDGELD